MVIKNLILFDKNQGCAAWDIHLDVMVTVAPRTLGSEKLASVTDTIMAAKFGFISVECDLVLASLRGANTVVCEGLCWVEVEDEDGPASIES